ADTYPGRTRHDRDHDARGARARGKFISDGHRPGACRCVRSAVGEVLRLFWLHSSGCGLGSGDLPQSKTESQRSPVSLLLLPPLASTQRWRVDIRGWHGAWILANTSWI